MFKGISRAALLGGSAFVALATAAQAAPGAQQGSSQAAAQAEAPPAIAEVVVTAQRTEQKLQKVPVAETAFNATAIRNQNILSVADLQFHAPSVQIREESSFGGLTVAMRGISVSSENISFDPAVGIYVNDVFVARSGDFNSTFYDVANVQVLRGPQGTLFGRDTPVGAVLVDTTRPGSRYGGYVQADIGGGGHGLGAGADRNTYRFEGAVDMPVTPDFGIRLAGFYLNDNGWGRSRTTGFQNSSNDEAAVRATLAWKPTDHFKASLIFDHSESKEGAPVFVVKEFTAAGLPHGLLTNTTADLTQLQSLIAHPDPYYNDSAFTNQLGKHVTNSAILHLDYAINDDWSVRSITGWRHTALSTFNDTIGVNYFEDGITTTDLHQNQVSEEVVLNGTVAHRLHILGGLFYFQETGDQTVLLASNVLNLPAPTQATLRLQGYDVNNVSKSVFGNVAYDILPNLTASVGLRYNDETKRISLNNDFLLGNLGTTELFPFGAFAHDSGSFKGDNVLYDAKLTWNITPRLLVYGKYGTGYRAGGVGFEAQAPVPFQPETSGTYEIGLKSDFTLASIPFRFNTALFDSEYKNFQIPDITSFGNPPVTLSGYINAGTATIRGAELELTARPTDALTLTSSLSLIDAHYGSFTLDSLDFSHNQLRDTPKVAFTLSAGYTVPSSIGTWMFQGDYSYKSTYQTDVKYQPGAPGSFNSNIFQQGPTNVLNARITLQKAFGSTADLSIWAKNITDQTRIAYALGTPTLKEVVYAEPLSYGIQLRAAF